MKTIGQRLRTSVSNTHTLSVDLTAVTVELKEPEYSERVALFKKEHHHKIAVNKSRDVNSQFDHPKARQQVQRP